MTLNANFFLNNVNTQIILEFKNSFEKDNPGFPKHP